MKTFATKPLLEMHRKDVLEIYKLGIETKNATFNTSVPTWDEWDKGHLQHSRFYVEIDKRIAGWIALSPVSSRCNYSGVAEVSIYIHLHHISSRRAGLYGRTDFNRACEMHCNGNRLE